MTDIQTLRGTFARVIIGYIWLNAVLTGVISVLVEGGFNLTALGGSLLLAVGATLTWRSDGTGMATRITTSMVVAAQVALMVYAASGSAYQVDLHMYFFAALAICAGWCDWRALVANAAVVAIHHLALNYVMPSAVFPASSPDVARVLIHAVILVNQAVALCWITLKLEQAFLASDTSLTQATAAEQEADRLARSQAARAEDESRKRAALQTQIADFQTGVHNLLQSLTTDISALSATATQLGTIADSTTTSAGEAEATSQQTSETVQSVASASEQMNVSIAQIATAAEQAKMVVEATKHEADVASGQMQELAHETESIREIVAIIQNIAAQTNLLALNATIEAARAGDLGKGFAVVAGEVKTLADQTQRATEDIERRISTAAESSMKATIRIGEITARVEELLSVTLAISASMEQQKAATSEISSSITAASDSVRILASVAESTNKAAAVTKDAASRVHTSQSAVSDTANQLAHCINGFVSKVAAA